MAHERAGQVALPEDLINVPHLVTAYYTRTPDPENPMQQVLFGTSGHRGSSLDSAFNEAHILATTQAIVEYRASQGIDGPLFIGRDTHALSEPAWLSALEVLVANDVVVLVDSRDAYTPTPAVSHAILRYNSTGPEAKADGIVVTPSHNPPRDGGFNTTRRTVGPRTRMRQSVIADRANELLRKGLSGVRRVTAAQALDRVERYDFLRYYVEDLPSVLNIDAIRDAGIRIGADPLGGASVDYWGAIAETHRLDLEVVNPLVDPTWRFMTLDTDGKIRMDCSSPDAMASLIGIRDRYDIATGNDADSDRHGIVTPDGGLMNPNHYLAVAIEYLFANRPGWGADTKVGKTLVSSSMIDRVVSSLGRELLEVPVGFKWFVPGLLDGFRGIRRRGKRRRVLPPTRRFRLDDGQGRHHPCVARVGNHRRDGKVSVSALRRVGREVREPGVRTYRCARDTRTEAVLAKLSPDQVSATELAGEPITATLTAAPGNGAAIGGLKVTTENAWFAARPSGTEDVYKIYAESMKGADHLAQVQAAAKDLVSGVLKAN